MPFSSASNVDFEQLNVCCVWNHKIIAKEWQRGDTFSVIFEIINLKKEQNTKNALP